MMDEGSDVRHLDLPDLNSDNELQHPRYSLNATNSNNNSNLQHTFQSQDPNKPIQKMIKSGSQVLGKCRSRLNLSRKEMLKKLNDKNDKISHMVEAAHATRPTSNERSSTKKPTHTDIVSNLSISKDLDFHRQQLFTQKYQGTNQRFNLPTQFTISHFEANGAGASRSEERPSASGNKSIAAQNIQELKGQKRQAMHGQNNTQNVNAGSKRGGPEKGIYHDAGMRREAAGAKEGDANHHDEDGEDEENKNVVNIQKMNNSYSDIIKKQMAQQQKMMQDSAAQQQSQPHAKGHGRQSQQSQVVQMHPHL